MATEVAPARTTSVGAHPPVGRRERSVIAVLTVAFGLLLTLWATVMPTYQAPDELTHVDAAVHLAIGDAWVDPGDLRRLEATSYSNRPGALREHAQVETWGALLDRTHERTDTNVNQMSQHPPTYYAIVAGVLHLVDFRALPTDVGVVVMRLTSALFVLPLPALAWATIRRVTRSPRAAVAGGFAVLAVPELASIGAATSNDAPVMLFGAVTVWLVTRVLTGDERTRTVVALAVSLGVAITFKATALPLVPFVAVALLLAPWRRFPARSLRALWVLAAAAVIGAAWWLRNLIVFRSLQPSGFESVRPPRPFPEGTGPDPVAFANQSWSAISWTFWGAFGNTASITLTPVVYETATVLSLGAVLVFAFRRQPGLRTAVALAVLPATVFVFQTANAWGNYTSTTIIAATQGRYYFPAMVAFIALAAIGWRRAVRTPSARTRFVRVFTVLAAAMSVYGIVYAWMGEAEDGQLLVTAAGLRRFATWSALPWPVVASVAVAFLAALVVSVVAARRVGSSSAAAGATLPAVPTPPSDTTPAPSDATPTPAPPSDAGTVPSDAPVMEAER